MIDRDLRILELVVCVQMSHAQLGDLAGGTGDRSLVALAAGLGVVEGPKSIGGDVLDLLEKLLIRGTPGGIGKSIALVVESGCRFGRLGG